MWLGEQVMRPARKLIASRLTYDRKGGKKKQTGHFKAVNEKTNLRGVG